MSANITKKSDATGYLNQSINLSTDPYLTPTPIIPIKSGNLKQYLNRFIEWIFPGTPTDVRGKVLGVPSYDISGAPNTDYSGLEWLTMMPLGGIAMYAVNGINKDIGGYVFKAMINTVDPSNSNLSNFTKELDGFLFCDGQEINVGTGSGNEKYAPLQKLLVGYYGNITGNTLKLPNMNGRVPLGYVRGSGYGDNPSTDIENYAKTGQIGGDKAHRLTWFEMPEHTHTYKDSYVPLDGEGYDPEDDGRKLDYNADYDRTTTPAGRGDRHENRQPYMVLSYIIKY